jgi:hypothetical protein
MSNRHEQKMIRGAMNKLLGIEHDRDIIGVGSPPQDDFDWYEDDNGGPGPTIHPMRPHWDNLKSDWNWKLCELFVTYLEDSPDGPKVTLTNDDMLETQQIFYERLSRLKREIVAAVPKQGERAYQTRERLEQKKKVDLGRQRPNTRRKQVGGPVALS